MAAAVAAANYKPKAATAVRSSSSKPAMRVPDLYIEERGTDGKVVATFKRGKLLGKVRAGTGTLAQTVARGTGPGDQASCSAGIGRARLPRGRVQAAARSASDRQTANCRFNGRI